MQNINDILNAYNKAKENTFDNSPLPAGTYRVKVEKIELGETKKEPKRPMGKIQFRIVEGQHKKQCLFLNQILVGNDKNTGEITAFGLKKFDDFLNSLQPTFEVRFSNCKNGFEDYKDLLLDVAEDIANLTYDIELTYKGDFPEYKVVEFYE